MEIIKFKVFFIFLPRLWPLPYRRPSSSTQTCRWQRQWLSGKQSHPPKTATGRQRYGPSLCFKTVIRGLYYSLQTESRGVFFCEVIGWLTLLSLLICSCDSSSLECPLWSRCVSAWPGLATHRLNRTTASGAQLSPASRTMHIFSLYLF